MVDIGLDVVRSDDPPGGGGRRRRLASRRAADGHKWQAAVWVVAGLAGHDRRRPPGLGSGVPGRGRATSRCPAPGSTTTRRRRPRSSAGRCPPLLGSRRCSRRPTASAPWPSVRAWVPDRSRRRRSGRWWPAGLAPSWSTATASRPSADRGRRHGRRARCRRCSPPTTASSPVSRVAPRAPTGSPPSARWRPRPAPWCCSRARRRSWPRRTAPCSSRPRATPGWPPPAPATCSPGSSAPCWPAASPPLEAAAAGAFLHGRAGALGWRRGLVAGDLLDQLPIVIDPLQE